jgi:hypothetical protein
METIPTIVLYLASSAALIASVTYAASLIIALRQPKVIHRGAIRKQLHNSFLDLDYNILDTDTFEDCVRKTVRAIDMSGVAFEKVKADWEEDQARKRAEGPSGPYNDPTQVEKSRSKAKGRKKKDK